MKYRAEEFVMGLSDRAGRRTLAAFAVLGLCAAMAACETSKKAGHGVLEGLNASSPSAQPTSSIGVTAAPTTIATTGPRGGSGGGSAGPAKVTITVTSPADVVTSICPHTFTVNGKISVSKGPIDLTYGWVTSEAGITNPFQVHFGGAGPQSITVTDQFVAQPVVDQTFKDQLRVVGQPFDDTRSLAVFSLKCGGSSSNPVSSDSGKACPFTTTFSAVISVTAGPQLVAGEYRFSDGRPSTRFKAYFPGTGYQQKLMQTVETVKDESLNNTVTQTGLVAWIVLTSAPAMTTSQATAECSGPVNQGG